MKTTRLLAVSLITLATLPVFGGIADGLLVNIDFNQGTFNTVENSSVTSSVIGANGQPKYSTPTQGKFARAGVFNNTTDGQGPSDWAISLGNLNSVYASDFSFSLWVNTTSMSKRTLFGNAQFITNGDLTNNSDTIGTGWTVLTHDRGMFKSSTDSMKEEAMSIRTGDWVNLIAVVDRSTNPAAPVVYWYRNGVLLNAGGDAFGSGSLDSGNNTIIGAAGTGDFGADDVMIDDVGIWNRKLVAGEIASLQTDSISSLSSVPEPSTYGIGAAGLAAVVAWKRRRSPRRA